MAAFGAWGAPAPMACANEQWSGVGGMCHAGSLPSTGEAAGASSTVPQFASGLAASGATQRPCRKRPRSDGDDAPGRGFGGLAPAGAAACDGDVESFHRAQRARFGLIPGPPPHPARGPMDAWIVGVNLTLAAHVSRALVVVMDQFSSYVLHLSSTPLGPGATGDAAQAAAEAVLQEALVEAHHTLPSCRQFAKLPAVPQACYGWNGGSVADFFEFMAPRAAAAGRSGAGTTLSSLSSERLLCARSTWNVRASKPAATGAGTPTFRFFDAADRMHRIAAANASKGASAGAQQTPASASSGTQLRPAEGALPHGPASGAGPRPGASGGVGSSPWTGAACKRAHAVGAESPLVAVSANAEASSARADSRSAARGPGDGCCSARASSAAGAGGAGAGPQGQAMAGAFAFAGAHGAGRGGGGDDDDDDETME